MAKIGPATAADSPHPHPRECTLIVGIGASAGGLESLEKFFAKVPHDSDMAFVVVQHLSPDFKSVMDELLGRKTKISICHAENGMPVTGNTIFLIPPGKEAILSEGRFLLQDRELREMLTLPIDHFFRSLAQEAGPRAVAVVLSGSGSDGSRGIIDVHKAGGLVVAESPDTARFGGMPVSAQETGVVDLILEPDDIPQAVGKRALEIAALPTPVEPPQDREGAELREGVELILQMLHHECGINFSQYKGSTVSRRIERRVAMQQFQSLDHYARHLENDPEELNRLYYDLLIGVTRFFRDPAAFELLEQTVIPQVLDRVAPNDEVRVWVAGCATGEEAYSLAILFREQLEQRKRPLNLKIFATDVHPTSLESASTGFYPEAAFENVSAKRRERFFTVAGDGRLVDAELRKLIVFARHNVLSDAPFIKLDMISCRNLLIYFQPEARKKALSLLHFGLRANGVLLLGPSESPDELSDEFAVLDEHWKTYTKRRNVRLPTEIHYPLTRVPGGRPRPVVPAELAPSAGRYPDGGLLDAYDWMLDRHMPSAVLIDETYQLLHVFGDADNFMSQRKGRHSGNVLDSFESELRAIIPDAVQRVRQNLKPVRYSGVRISSGAMAGIYRIRFEPVKSERATRQMLLISFERAGDQTPAPAAEVVDIANTSAASLSRNRINALEAELRHTRDNLQATVEKLKTSNEELVASNEELQSTNEELHSVNEELFTVNAEYQKKITDLQEITADLDNLIESTDVAILFLDKDLHIRKFTPRIEPVFKLVPQDTGRSLESFAHYIDRPGLIDEIRQVLATGEPLEDEVRDQSGRWLSMRILPYRSSKHKDGVVLNLIDIDALKQTQQSLASAVKDRERFLAMISHEMRNPVSAVLSAAHLLRSSKSSEQVMENALSVIQRQSDHISHLLDDLLDVSRLTQNKLQLRKQNINFRAVVDAAIETMRPLIDRHSQNLVIDISDSRLPVHGDLDRLRQAIENLLGNASKYSPEHSKIELTVSRADGEVVVQIRDQGDGISTEMLAHIFKPFTQLPRTRDQREGGMGVGLSLVKFIVDRHDGIIDVKSEGNGKGSLFSMRLPLISTDQPGDRLVETSSGFGEPVSAATTESDPGSGKNFGRTVQSILVVEHQRDNREMLGAFLEMEGFGVLMARNAAEGIDMADASMPDAALVDLGLPEDDSYQFALRLRQKHDHDIFLIALTAQGESHQIASASNAGFDEHLVKPIDLDRLLKLLKSPS